MMNDISTEQSKFVGIYVRVSTDKQVKYGSSLEAQKKEGIVFAKNIFGEDMKYEIYVDEGLSAKGTDKRNDLNRMMLDAKNGKLSAIITYKASRLSRTLSDSL